ncbi:hypothetical protein B0A55_06035 [Friedmanniomyces simplex]|uniref:Uncharacterized protein n=1 Tax=Friedmanniomyces simplex TaxID=329884 RepID=A0A4U0X5L3_9PEZI|nr:hypothetical protein B0A55_06035 [Friedmanniomyces simplex]
METDVSNAMAGLQLQQRNSESLMAQKHAQGQAQQQAQQQQYRYQQQHQPQNHQQTPPQARMMAQHEPLQAPMPQRPQQQPPPVASVQSPVSVPTTQHTTWQEGMPILFGGTSQAGAGAKANGAPQQQPVDGRWDPAQGVRFVPR